MMYAVFDRPINLLTLDLVTHFLSNSNLPIDGEKQKLGQQLPFDKWNVVLDRHYKSWAANISLHEHNFWAALI